MLVATSTALPALHNELVGQDVRVPLLNGTTIRPANFDHAASTPALRAVQTTVNRFLDHYSSVHRGTGFLSRLATQAYEDSRAVIGRFVGARADQHVVIFGANTTWAINKLARRIAFRPDDVVISTGLEHHANDLSWRQVAQVVYVRADDQGQLDEDHLATLLQRYAGRVRLVAVTGGSNVTGVTPAVHRLAVLAHAAGAEIFVDCAQLAPHRPIDIGDLDDPAHLDYIAFSGHKLYAPFGSGVLIGRRDTFSTGVPEAVGGGTVKRVTPDAVTWAETPARDEAGTPNVVGAVALAAAVLELQRIGLDTISAHETELTAYALDQLNTVPGLRLYGNPDPEQAHTRLGVIPFTLEGVDHQLVATILSCEYGIAVRCGAFCSQPYVRRLLEAQDADITCGSPSQGVGMIRASLGLATTVEDIDRLVEGLRAIAHGRYQGDYVLDSAHGSYQPRDWQPPISDYFSLAV